MPQPTPAPIHDIVDALPLPGIEPWVLGAGGAAAALLLAALVWFAIRNRKPRAVSARERALEALAGLSGKDLPLYDFAIAVSDVLRHYIDERHGVLATRQTSVEFLDAVRANPAFTDNERAALRDFLETVDLIKFARHNADDGVRERLAGAADNLIRSSGAETQAGAKTQEAAA